MKRACLVVLFAATIFSMANCFAWYDPKVGRWLSKDPAEEEGGINLYAYCVNDPVNKIDPFGLDFIVVGDATIILPSLRHLALRYYKGCPPDDHDKFYSLKDIMKNGATPQGAIELIPERFGWYTWVKGNYPGPSGATPHGSFPGPMVPGWRALPVWISVVRNGSHATREKVLYFDSDDKNVKNKWRALLSQAGSYGYATSDPPVNPTANDVYELFGNNSNTFIKTIVRGAGLPASKLNGPYPGRESPVNVSNIYSTPWQLGAPQSPMPVGP